MNGKASRTSLLSVLLWVVIISSTLTFLVAGVLLGDLNQDEGWYLYAARLVAEGELPYVDFATTQGPVMPFVYALANPLVTRFGVVAGRCFTAFLGLLSILCAAWLSRRIAPAMHRDTATLLAVALAGVNVYQCYFYSIAKTYALAGVFFTSGFVALSYAGGRKGKTAAGLAGVLMALATATRSSAGFAVPFVVIGLWWFTHRKRNGASATATMQPGVLYSFVLAGLISGLVLFLPFFVLAPEAVWFALVEYHAGRAGGEGLAVLAYKAGFLSRLASAYTAGIVLFICCTVYRAIGLGASGAGGSCAASEEEDDVAGSCSRVVTTLGWCSIAAITFVHFMAPFPYDDYQVFIYPLFAALLGSWTVRLLASRHIPLSEMEHRSEGALVCVTAMCLICALGSPLIWQWSLGERDRMWWPLKDQTPLSKLQETGRYIRQQAPPGSELLTQDTYIAVETGLKVPKGLELGPFSYFPDWSRERAEASKVLNHDMLLELLRTTEAPLAAFSGYSLSIKCPEVLPVSEKQQGELWKTVNDRYKQLRIVERFGQAETTLMIMRKGE